MPNTDSRLRVQPHRVLRRIPRFIHVVCGAGIAVGLPAAYACSRDAGAATIAAKAAAPLPNIAEIRDKDIEFYTARAKRDPTGATDLSRLAGLYLDRARETGDPHDAVRAEEAARRSLHNRRSRNDRSAQILSSALLSQHRFTEALTVAQELSAADTSVVQFRAAVGEIEMELGQYDAARATFDALRWDARDASVAPRLARWDEIEGRVDEAKQLMRVARLDAMKAPNTSPEHAAWFWLRSGDLELRAGQPNAAESAYARGLVIHPGDYRLLAAMAHLASVRQQWKQAVSYGEQAVAANLDPATLGTVSDAYAALGDTARAAEYARVLDVAVLKQPGAYHRAWSLFLLDHNRHVAMVHGKILDELKTRRDIYGYDLLAWSLYKQGRYSEAWPPMQHALAQGTVDAQLFYHAGMIERALARNAEAKMYLTKALAVNPYFHPMQPAVARAVLDSISTS